YAYWPVVTKGSISPSSLISSIESIQESKSSGASQSLSSNNALSYHVPHVSKMSGKPETFPSYVLGCIMKLSIKFWSSSVSNPSIQSVKSISCPSSTI